MNLTTLRVSHMDSPLGIDTPPYFSWIIQSGERGVFQASYRLVVSLDGESVWDSGTENSSQSIFVPYDGPELKSRERYLWTVYVTDNHGNTASASSRFETAFMSADEWKAGWVVSPFPFEEREKDWGNQPPATMFRKGFALKGAVSSARLYFTCHGIYRLTVNGKRPDDREFAPEFTSYDHYLCYQTYDVTGLLVPGENALGAYVGDGWYCGPMTVRDFIDDPPHAVLFQLEVTYADGSAETVCSDESVLTARGPVLFSDFFAGEKYDANLEQTGWDKAGYSCPGWENAQIGEFGYGNLVAQIGQPVRPAAALPAVRVYTSPKGESIVDFGENLAGRVRMKIDAPKGAVITLDHFEAPDKEGNYFNNIYIPVNGAVCEQRVYYISNGRPSEYEPLFTYHGFRYVRVTGLDAVRAEDFTAVALSTDNRSAGTFGCSDARLNRLYENIRRTQRSNMISIPTDCPQREKAGWTGDAHAYAATSMMNEDMTSFYTRWLRNLALEQAEDGRVPLTIPYPKYYKISEIGNMLYQKEQGIPDAAGFSDAAVIMPYTMYEITGNTLILREQYQSMKRWCDYVIVKSAKRGSESLPEEIERYLWNTGFHYGDWMIPGFLKTGYGAENLSRVRATSLYTAPVFGWYSLTLTAKAAALLGNEEDAAYYGGMAENTKQAFASGIIDKDGNMPMDLQSAYILPLYFGLVPEGHKEHFADKLVSLIRLNGNCLDTGFFSTPLLLDTLCAIGREDMAYELLYREDCPSWLYQLRHDATTIWESWHCYGDDGTPLAMSMNHYAFGSVGSWMFRYITGIEYLEPGYKRFKIHPRPDATLINAKRTFMCEYGQIACGWERGDGVFKMEVTVPCNTSANVILPDGSSYDVGSGQYSFECADNSLLK